MALAASELVRVHEPSLHGAFVQALLASVHVGGADLLDGSTLSVAATVAGVSSEMIGVARVATEGTALLSATIDEAAELGVSAVPTIYRNGPVLRIRTTPAVDSGGSLRSLETIDRMLEDDALWELGKP